MPMMTVMMPLMAVSLVTPAMPFVMGLVMAAGLCIVPAFIVLLVSSGG